MRKRITSEDRRLIAKVNTRLAKGLTWEEIGADLGIDWKQAYNRLYGRTVTGPDGLLIPIDRLHQEAAA